MKVKVDQGACISCSLCVDQCPAMFGFNSNNKAEEKSSTVDERHSEHVKLAAYECPTSAIKLS